MYRDNGRFRVFLNKRLNCYHNSPAIDEIVAEHERIVNKEVSEKAVAQAKAK